MAQIALTADKSLMVHFPATLYAGFLSCFPTKSMPDVIYRRVLPPVKAKKDGTTDYPTMSLRAVEAICRSSGFGETGVKIAHPDHLKKIVKSDTRIVGVSSTDPLGIGPETTFWSSILSGEPHNRVKFARLMQDVVELKKRFGFEVVMGGPGSWQFADEDLMELFGIDHVVLGEAEHVIPDLFNSIVAGDSLPRRIHEGKIASVDEIQPISGPTNSSIIEVARGCGRGCQFCAPNVAGRLRSVPAEKILADAQVYLDWNIKTITLHSEDTLRYGSSGFLADEDALLGLYKDLFSLGAKNIFITHANLATFANQPELIERLSKLLRANGMPGYGSQVGLETGSSRLTRKYMKGKCLPREPEEWAQVVKEGLEVAESNRWISCCTVLMGLPDEDDEDVRQTMRLIEDVDNRFAFYFPIFFVPIGTTPLKDHARFVYRHASPYHWRLILQCWKHNVKYVCQAFDLASEGRHPVLRLGLRVGIKALYNVIEIICKRMIKRTEKARAN